VLLLAETVESICEGLEIVREGFRSINLAPLQGARPSPLVKVGKKWAKRSD
jgi:hypothetical protein